jgi:uncharacterized RDD family membrane protein YckC
MTALPPAPWWRRYAAWSLDFAFLGALATWLAWPRIVSGWEAAASAMQRLSDLLGHALADGLLQGATPALLTQQLLGDAQVRTAASMVQAGLDRIALSWLLIYAVLAALYHVGFESSPWRGSPGKHALQLRVAGFGHHGVSLPRIIARHFASALSWLTLNLGHVMAMLPPNRRALHDVIAGMRVESAGETPRLPLWARLWLALQVLVVLLLAARGLQRYVEALQASLL